MSYNDFFVPDAGSSATPTEDLHNALRESAIAMSDLTDALASRPQRRGPAPAPVGGVTKARQTAPSGRKAHPRVDANGQPSQRTAKACLNCRRKRLKCGGEEPSCGRCSEKGQLCRYANTEYEFAIQIADAMNESRRQEAYARVASAPQHRRLKPRSGGPLGPFRKLAPAPVSPPSFPEQINQTNSDPVQSSAELSQYIPSLHTATQNTPTLSTSTLYTPHGLTPNQPVQSSAELSQYIPSLHTATQNTPTLSTSTLYTPHELTPNQFAPSRFGQNLFESNQLGETFGNWNPRPLESSQNPQGAGLTSDGLGNWPDETSQFPQQYQLARTNHTQPQYGQLSYNTQPPYEQPPSNGELDFAAGSSSDQIGGISHYPIASNTVYDGAATWQDTYWPDQYQAEMGSMFFGLPAGNSYNAQTPAESFTMSSGQGFFQTSPP